MKNNGRSYLEAPILKNPGTAIVLQHLFSELVIFLIFPKDMTVFPKSFDLASCIFKFISFTDPLMHVYIKNTRKEGFHFRQRGEQSSCQARDLYEFPAYLLTPAVFHR